MWRPLLNRIAVIALDAVGAIAYQLEYFFIILVAESLVRLRWRLDPRLYFESLRIRSVTAGGLAKGSRKFALLVLYTDSSLPSFTATVIDAIARSQFDLVIVSNGAIDADLKSELLGKSCLFIERVNIGRDFGGYKDGISIIRKLFLSIDRLLLLNDSVYYFGEGIDKVIADLDGPQDFIGVSEVFEHHYHVASFMLSFGRAIIDARAFGRFWNDYLPISTRQWAIHRGEGALTKCLLSAGYRPHILFQADHLLPILEILPPVKTFALLKLLPKNIRLKLHNQHKMAVYEGAVSALDSSKEPKSHAPGTQLADSARLKKDIASDIISTITARNQMHTGGLLFVKFLKLPMIKRDLVYRGHYSQDEIQCFLACLGEALIDDVIADLHRRGTPAQLGGIKRVFYRHHVI